MNNRSSYSEDFKALVIKLAHESSVKQAAVQAGVSEQAIYAWLEAWNTKKKRGL
jgi:transposase-like protein